MQLGETFLIFLSPLKVLSSSDCHGCRSATGAFLLLTCTNVSISHICSSSDSQPDRRRAGSHFQRLVLRSIARV